uniref:Recep_L_domain domain-containing protein n=1 Tax=Steinernema glaseri TaxID=37863 RepID=A0A1I8ATX7_9BILA
MPVNITHVLSIVAGILLYEEVMKDLQITLVGDNTSRALWRRLGNCNPVQAMKKLSSRTWSRVKWKEIRWRAARTGSCVLEIAQVVSSESD